MTDKRLMLPLCVPTGLSQLAHPHGWILTTDLFQVTCADERRELDADIPNRHLTQCAVNRKMVMLIFQDSFIARTMEQVTDIADAKPTPVADTPRTISSNIRSRDRHVA